MDEWHPREHDHLVEPVFGGLGARRPEQRSRRRLLLAGVALAGALIALRALQLAL